MASRSASLADGAPSKQPQSYYSGGGSALSRSASAHSDLSFRPGEQPASSAIGGIGGGGGDLLWTGTGKVELADGSGIFLGSGSNSNSKSNSRCRLKEPKDDQARQRYEDLFEKLVVKQRLQSKKRKQAQQSEGVASNASTVRGEAKGGGDTNFSMSAAPGGGGGGGGGVQALRGWFESDSVPPPASASTSNTPTTSAISTNTSTSAINKDDATSPFPSTETDREAIAIVAPRTIYKLWTRSRLSHNLLASVWDQAITLQSSSPTSTTTKGAVVGMSKADSKLVVGLEKETFVRTLATIDAELERKKKKKEIRQTSHSRPHPQRQAMGGRERTNEASVAFSAASTASTAMATGRRVPPPPPAPTSSSS